MYGREKNIGKVFGEVTVLEFVRVAKGSSIYTCKCSCGVIKEFYIGNLRSGKSLSCGCITKQLLSERSKTHGERRTRLYGIWTNMKSRCYNENVDSYEHYGARGISICEEWRDSYEKFRDWAVKNGYSDSLSIDRIDANGDYSPENCRWATDIQQARNKTTTWFVEINGVKKTAKEWCEIYGVNYKTAHTRKSRGWSDVNAVSTA